MDCGYFSGRYRQQLKCHVSLPGPMPSEVNLGVRRFISAFQSRVRTSPLASELPLTCQALPFAGGPGGPLTCRATPANSSPFAALTTPKGLRSLRSASSLSFLIILLPQNNSLTFVRGADRACCAPRKWQCSLTCMPRKWSCRPTTACLYQPPHALRRGIGVRTRRRHLAARACCAPRKRLCRPTTACQYQPPHAPRRGIGVRTRQRHLAAALGSGTLPPVLWHLLFSAKGLLQLYQSRMRLSIGAAEFFTIFLSWSGKGGEIQLLRAARKAEGETP